MHYMAKIAIAIAVILGEVKPKHSMELHVWFHVHIWAGDGQRE